MWHRFSAWIRLGMAAGMLAGIVSTGFLSPASVAADTILAEITSTQDNYGYLAEPITVDWINILGTADEVVEITSFSPNADDAYVGPYPIGFEFWFYENPYSQLRISTNGYLTLDAMASEQLLRNLDLPSDQKPNSIIAPFWDDLVKGSGNLYYARGNLDGQAYFAVCWNAFSRFNAVETVTFQVFLLANGDILYQYASMNGNLAEASVGIEDGDGVDGIAYLFDGVGTMITSHSSIRFTRPDAGRRAKLTPLYSGGFIVGGKVSFNITLANTGDVTEGELWDSYSLTSSIAAASLPGWQVFYLLNGIPVTSSGALAQHASQAFQVLVLPPDLAAVGDHALIRLKATSTKDTTRSATISVQVTVPTKIMHTYKDSQGMHLGLYWKENVASVSFPSYDDHVALEPAGEKYILAWEEKIGSNLSYMVVNELGIPDSYLSRLETNSYTFDKSPFLASSAEDIPQVAVVWTRSELSAEYDPIYNLMLAVLNPYLEDRMVIPPLKVTDNQVPYTAISGVWMQDASAIWVNSDSLWLVWKEQHAAGSTDIRAGLFNLSSWSFPSGTLPLATGIVAELYSDPTLIRLADGTVLVFFIGENTEQKTKQIYWASLSTSGTIEKTRTAVGSLQGDSLDAAWLNDQIMLAWVTPDRGAVSYTLISLSGSGSSLSLIPSAAQYLVLENHNLVESITLFADQEKHGVLTWKNVDSTQMYYALVDSSGVLRTPGVMFFQDPDAGIMVSQNGQSSTVYVGAYRLALPLISR